tara:strand:+ start:8416 stop:8601 length:186 start_codon:yes stop_codon:yes gene_type:complete
MRKNEKPTLKAIHIRNSLQPQHKPKIAKEYVSPTLTLELNNKHSKNQAESESTMHNNVYKT